MLVISVQSNARNERKKVLNTRNGRSWRSATQQPKRNDISDRCLFLRRVRCVRYVGWKPGLKPGLYCHKLHVLQVDIKAASRWCDALTVDRSRAEQRAPANSRVTGNRENSAMLLSSFKCRYIHSTQTIVWCAKVRRSHVTSITRTTHAALHIGYTGVAEVRFRPESHLGLRSRLDLAPKRLTWLSHHSPPHDSMFSWS